MANMPREDAPGALSLTDLLDDAVRLAEELAAPPADRWAAARLRDELVPALYDARSYAELSMYGAPEIRLGIAKAARLAGSLLDGDTRYSLLFSRLRILLEAASSAAPK